eukprot:GDKJ01012283.1.p1 GENE.GDKJ01012283.1~~GDKJ01012283.1.p1  ORF type:complete len:672 (+),score=114.36 GDKJ01012283.1:46-2061(+)
MFFLCVFLCGLVVIRSFCTGSTTNELAMSLSTMRSVSEIDQQILVRNSFLWLTASPERIETCQGIIISLKDALVQIYGEGGKIDALYLLDAYLYSLSQLPNPHLKIPLYKRRRLFVETMNFLHDSELISETSASVSHNIKMNNSNIPGVKLKMISTCSSHAHHRLPSLAFTNRLKYMYRDDEERIVASLRSEVGDESIADGDLLRKAYQRNWVLKSSKRPHVTFQYNVRATSLFNFSQIRADDEPHFDKESENNSLQHEAKTSILGKSFEVGVKRKTIPHSKHSARLNSRRDKKSQHKLPAPWLKLDDILRAMGGVENDGEGEKRMAAEKLPDWIMWIDCDAFVSTAHIDAAHLLSGILSKMSPGEEVETSLEEKQAVWNMFSQVSELSKSSSALKWEQVANLIGEEDLGRVNKLPLREFLKWMTDTKGENSKRDPLAEMTKGGRGFYPSVLTGEEAKTDIILSNDHVYVNSGVFFVRNTVSSFKKLVNLRLTAERSSAFRNAPWWEQTALGLSWILPVLLSRLDADVDRSWQQVWGDFGIKLVPQHWINSFSSVNEDYGRPFLAQEDFIIHFAGCGRKDNIGKCAEEIENLVTQINSNMNTSKDVISKRKSISVNRKSMKRMIEGLENDIQFLFDHQNHAAREARLDVAENAKHKLAVLKSNIKDDILIY